MHIQSLRIDMIILYNSKVQGGRGLDIHGKYS